MGSHHTAVRHREHEVAWPLLCSYGIPVLLTLQIAGHGFSNLSAVHGFNRADVGDSSSDRPKERHFAPKTPGLNLGGREDASG